MPATSILDKTSFGFLDPAGQQAVCQLFNLTYLGVNYKDGTPFYVEHLQLFRQRKSLAVSIDLYGSKLEKVNPAVFKYLNPQQQEALEQELLFSFYILSAQYQLDEAEHRRQGLHARGEQIKNCARLINELRKSAQRPTPATILASATDDDSERHAKYLGLTLVAPLVAKQMLELTEGKTTPPKKLKGAGKTVVVKEWMGEVNGRRLYWVWGGGLVSTVISLLPNDLGYQPQAEKAITAPSPVTGYMSWILYYARFGINLSLLLKHSIAGPWMSTAEKQLPPGERFKTQWEQRKFSLLNDSIWATANLACFFWLTGRGMLGYYGNVVTAALLLMDISLATWRFYEESTQHNLEIQRFENDIAALRTKIAADKENQLLQLQLNALIKAKMQLEFDWRYKKYNLVNDLVYATSLMIAFSLMCCFLFPPAAIVPATAIILGVAGAALCFVLNLAYATVTGVIDINKSRESKKSARIECETLLEQFKATDNDFVKKQLYLDMKQLLADSNYQQRLLAFQKMKLVRAVFIDVMVPSLVFVSLVFMPLGIGIAVLAAGFVLAVASSILLNRYAPKTARLPELNEEEYAAFARLPAPTLANLKLDEETARQEKPGFFCKGASPAKQKRPFGDEPPRESPSHPPATPAKG